MIHFFKSLLVSALSLTIATGVFVHDTRIDRAASSSSLRAQTSQRNIKGGFDPSIVSGDPHTHPEHRASTLHGFAYQTPAHPPREQRVKKHLMQNIEPRGRHAFDHYYLPVVG